MYIVQTLEDLKKTGKDYYGWYDYDEALLRVDAETIMNLLINRGYSCRITERSQVA